jgi:peptidoglycan/xylan/chitin deacetylase (PgdA/CDA1 family)
MLKGVSGRRTLAMRAVKTAATAADKVRAPARGVVVLIYHTVGAGTGAAVDVPTALFDEQMAALGESGRAMTLGDALDRLRQPEPPAVDPVVVTFDDGTADFADNAIAVLTRHGIPATLYLATDFVDTGRPFPGDVPALSWAAVRDCVATGLVDLGSHTDTHALLDRCPPEQVGRELDQSIELLREHAGVEARDFAYPKAVLGSPDAQDAVRSRFRSAALGGTRPNRYGHTDPYRLARSPIQVTDGMTWFLRKLEGGMGFEDTLRRGLNRIRYRNRVT